MRIEGEHVFNGSREDVWAMVRDPEVLATLVPGTTKLTQLSESEYEGEINLRIGPISGSFSGRIFVEDEVPPESCTLKAEGDGRAGFFKGCGTVLLTEQGDGTLMVYEGDIQIGGKLASIGQRLIDMTSKTMIRQGMKGLDVALEERKANVTDE
jgi:carbon monoxide dehydrogenase subunit G